jgi:AraC family transcriptional regulator of adaptative response/methylated-DNA-[protein]-cysteine methyltransferase
MMTKHAMARRNEKVVHPSAAPALKQRAHEPDGGDARWQAVLARDASYDGKFFYSVATTGIYCRPSCPSRRAKRSNVVFHESSEAAKAAGFRACKRCKPDQAVRDADLIAKVAQTCRVIESADTMPKLADLAALAKVSPFHFHRVFKSVTGVTPKAYAVAHRASRLRANLATAATVTRAMMDAGFTSSGRFYAQSADVLGMTPGRYKAGGTNTILTFAIAECSLGAILVAATDKGIAAILLGDDPAALLRDLQDRFPKAEFAGGDRKFEKLVARVIGLVEQPGRSEHLPLDVRGTAFQHQVWAALKAIPVGETASYREIAARIGKPKAYRAVALACCANPVAVAIPCHRVVRTDGGLAGYRWGLARKRTLLEREVEAQLKAQGTRRRQRRDDGCEE